MSLKTCLHCLKTSRYHVTTFIFANPYPSNGHFWWSHVVINRSTWSHNSNFQRLPTTKAQFAKTLIISPRRELPKAGGFFETKLSSLGECCVSIPGKKNTPISRWLVLLGSLSFFVIWHLYQTRVSSTIMLTTPIIQTINEHQLNKQWPKQQKSDWLPLPTTCFSGKSGLNIPGQSEGTCKCAQHFPCLALFRCSCHRHQYPNKLELSDKFPQKKYKRNKEFLKKKKNHQTRGNESSPKGLECQLIVLQFWCVFSECLYLELDDLGSIFRFKFARMTTFFGLVPTQPTKILPKSPPPEAKSNTCRSGGQSPWSLVSLSRLFNPCRHLQQLSPITQICNDAEEEWAISLICWPQKKIGDLWRCILAVTEKIRRPKVQLCFLLVKPSVWGTQATSILVVPRSTHSIAKPQPSNGIF